MKATKKLHDLGQSLWLDNITRELLTSGTLNRYIDDLSVTGLTSNPTIFDHAIKNSTDYDAAIRTKVKENKSGEELFFELALADITQAADLLRQFRTELRRQGETDGGEFSAGHQPRIAARPGCDSGESGNQKNASESPLPMSKKKCWPMPRGRSIVFVSGMPSTPE